MSVNVRANHRKNTFSAQLNTNMDGRSGCTNYAGHAWEHGIGLHISLDRDPARPVSVALRTKEDIDAVRALIAEYDRVQASK